MPLRSKLFGGDPLLEACLVRDSAHVTLGAKGAHVGKIQQALLLLDGARISPAETSTQTYGASSAAAVLAFKKRRKIINTSYETSEDNIVGKLTIARLDSELVTREVPGKANPLPALTIIPFHETTPLLIAKRDDVRTKGDLTSSPVPITTFSIARQVAIALARGRSTPQLQAIMRLELAAGGLAGIEAGNDFFANLVASSVIAKGVSSVLSGLVKASPEFRRANDSVKTFVTDTLSASAASGILDYQVLAEPKKKIPPPGLGFSGFQQLHIVVGSFQGVKISLESFSANGTTRRYTADLVYEWFDHFGVDDSDLDFDGRGHGSPGQVALWVLQRERAPGNRPYVVQVFIKETISDSF